MPYANPDVAKVSNRERQRRFRKNRAEQRRLAAMIPPELPDIIEAAVAAEALAAWCAERLIVPPGHPLQGQPMVMPDYVLDYLADVLQAASQGRAVVYRAQELQNGRHCHVCLGVHGGTATPPWATAGVR